MIKRYCDGCGKEIKPDLDDLTKPFIWWELTVHGSGDMIIELCNDCYKSRMERSDK